MLSFIDRAGVYSLLGRKCFHFVDIFYKERESAFAVYLEIRESYVHRCLLLEKPLNLDAVNFKMFTYSIQIAFNSRIAKSLLILNLFETFLNFALVSKLH